MDLALEVVLALDHLGLEAFLTECIDQLVLESQLPYKIVNLLFAITQ